jgi:riboflavin kinase
MEARESAAVGAAELAALKQVALDGGLAAPVKISCAGLGESLDASTQTASRRLQRLESAGLVERDVVSDGQWVDVTAEGERRLRREFEDYRRIFETASSLRLVGHVTSGMGEGRHYISLPGYMEQFADRLGYEPFAGTLNVELTDESVRARPRMAALDAVPIDGWEDDERTFGPATCYAATLVGGDERYDPVHIIVPERTHHDEGQLEVIAPVKLRDELGLADGDEIVVDVEAVDR